MFLKTFIFWSFFNPFFYLKYNIEATENQSLPDTVYFHITIVIICNMYYDRMVIDLPAAYFFFSTFELLKEAPFSQKCLQKITFNG